MTDPIAFTARTPRYALPNLFSAQAQKEFTINEALARIDMLVQPIAEGLGNVPPVSPAEGECWIVDAAPAGDWAEHEGALASFQSGNWLFVQPVFGMMVYNKAASSAVRYDGGWHSVGSIEAPSGGTTEDTEARAAIVSLIGALVTAGVVSPA